MIFTCKTIPKKINPTLLQYKHYHLNLPKGFDVYIAVELFLQHGKESNKYRQKNLTNIVKMSPCQNWYKLYSNQPTVDGIFIISQKILKEIDRNHVNVVLSDDL